MARRRPVARQSNAETSLQQQIDAAVADRMYAGDLSPWELPPVVAAIGAYADTISQLPFTATRDGQPRPDQPGFLTNPNDHERIGDLLNRAVNQLFGWGYFWVLPIWSATNPNWPVQIEVLDAEKAVAVFDDLGRLAAVEFAGERRRVSDKACPVLVSFHKPRSGSPGVSPIRAAWKVMEYAAALYEMSGSFFLAGTPSLAIEVPQRLSQLQAETLKRQTRSWRRSHEPVVLDADAKITTVGSTPLEMQLVEMCSWAVAEVARITNIPPGLLNAQANDSSTYQNGESELKRWKDFGLGAVVNRFEQAFSRFLPNGTIVEADYTELLAANDLDRFEALSKADWMTDDEKRAREGLGPIAGGDQLAPPTRLSVVGGTGG